MQSSPALHFHADGQALPLPAKLGIGLVAVALHLLAGWGLMHLVITPEKAKELGPLFVSWVAPPEPPKPVVEPPKPPPPKIKKITEPPPVIAAAPKPDAAPAFVAPPPPPEPVPQPVEPVVNLAPPSPAPAVAAQPKTVSASEVRYRVQPSIQYPAQSRRLNEQGRVLVRILIGTNGNPQQVVVSKSSGFSRLDDAVIAGIRRASFYPYEENGQAIPVWVVAPFDFNLD
ncbi:energy transducer TonB [Uliginosibacterium sp. H1]|uniref:energy transducer TonB n=1 Tax=Uliginosibacterium sp. H1 TaxID=3114757 RepID=UPI002E191B53|nr:energy transducer TonB [Uliginosibacterium sp. H1]